MIRKMRSRLARWFVQAGRATWPGRTYASLRDRPPRTIIVFEDYLCGDDRPPWPGGPLPGFTEFRPEARDD